MPSKFETLMHIIEQAKEATVCDETPARPNDSWAKAFSTGEMFETVRVKVAAEHRENFSEIIGDEEWAKRYAHVMRKHDLTGEEGFFDCYNQSTKKHAVVYPDTGEIEISLAEPLNAFKMMVSVMGSIHLNESEKVKLQPHTEISNRSVAS